MDIFGKAAKARVKALEETLAVERERNAELLRQVIALSDAKAYRVLNPSEVTQKTQTLHLETPPIVKKPTDSRSNIADTVRKARAAYRES